MSTHHLESFLQVNSKELIDGVMTDRNSFWQTIWAEDKFPKDEAEYLHEVKNSINRNKYLEAFSLNE